MCITTQECADLTDAFRIPCRLFGKAAAREEAKRTLGHVKPLSTVRTPLEDFINGSARAC
jgi:hypothetical protein